MRAGFWVANVLGKLHVNMCVWQDDTEMSFKGVGWEGTDWIHLAQCRNNWRAFVNMVMHLRVP